MCPFLLGNFGAWGLWFFIVCLDIYEMVVWLLFFYTYIKVLVILVIGGGGLRAF